MAGTDKNSFTPDIYRTFDPEATLENIDQLPQNQSVPQKSPSLPFIASTFRIWRESE
jgi:hypothetical protein